MLPLWRDRLRIVLCRDRVIILQLHGAAHKRVASKLIIPHADSETGWEPVLALLQGKLQGNTWNKADVTVILSNHFARFLVLPWHQASLSPAELQALVAHRFSEVYGAAAERSEYRLHEGGYGATILASALPVELFNKIIMLFSGSGLRLVSLQPYLMTAFNACRRELGQEEGWFVLAEREMVCVGLIQGGQWASIRLRRVVGDWFEEAMLLLEREALLAANGTQHHKVFVCAPECTHAMPEKRGKWLIRRLQSTPLPEFSAVETANYAMATAGL